MDNDQQVVMVGVSFEEIKAAAAAPVREQVDLQVQSESADFNNAVEMYDGAVRY